MNPMYSALSSPLKTYPISSWIFITLGAISVQYPIIIIIFIIFQIFNSYNECDPRAFGWILDFIEFTIGYKIASLQHKQI